MELNTWEEKGLICGEEKGLVCGSPLAVPHQDMGTQDFGYPHWLCWSYQNQQLLTCKYIYLTRNLSNVVAPLSWSRVAQADSYSALFTSATLTLVSPHTQKAEGLLLQGVGLRSHLWVCSGCVVWTQVCGCVCLLFSLLFFPCFDCQVVAGYCERLVFLTGSGKLVTSSEEINNITWATWTRCAYYLSVSWSCRLVSLMCIAFRHVIHALLV